MHEYCRGRAYIFGETIFVRNTPIHLDSYPRSAKVRALEREIGVEPGGSTRWLALERED